MLPPTPPVQGVASTQGDQRVRGEFTPATNNKGTAGDKPEAPKKN